MCREQTPPIFNEAEIDDVDYTQWDYSRPPKRKCSRYVKRQKYRHFDEDDDVKANMPVVPLCAENPNVVAEEHPVSVAHCPSEVESLETPRIS